MNARRRRRSKNASRDAYCASALPSQVNTALPIHLNRLFRWLPFLGWLAFIVTVIACADSGTHQRLYSWVYRQPMGDKAGHVFLIGSLAALLNYALRWRSTSLGWTRLQVGGLVIAALMTAEEFSQIWIATRTFDLLDLGSNYLGILCAEMLARWIGATVVAPPPNTRATTTQAGISLNL